MSKTLLPNNLIQLTSNVGILDVRTNIIHSIVICDEKKEKFYKEFAIEIKE